MPGVLPSLLQGNTFMDARRAEPLTAFPQEKGLGWERVVWLLTPTFTAIVVCTALRDPLGRNTAPLAALFQRPPGREVSSEGVPRGGWPGRPQQGVVVKQKGVSQQLVAVIEAAPGFPLRGNRQNTVCHTGH